MKKIQSVAVLGAGVMGATIAAHMVNSGLDVLLLDMKPKDINPDDPSDANRVANNALKALLKAKPAPFYQNQYASRVQAGNFSDDLGKISKCDWVIEVIIENMEIKKKFYKESIVPNIGPESYLSSNTSGLSVNEIAQGLPEQIRKNFLVTHFFNPPRYMRLLEIIPSQFTSQETLDYLTGFISKRLGKGVVFGKDTPNFIANRIGVFSIFNAIKHMVDLDMTVEEVDTVAGPATARPKSAAFRTADLVGIDTLAHIGKNTYDVLVDDEMRDTFLVPDFISKMIGDGLLGNKSGQGFYKKGMVDGKRQIYYYDYKTGEYKPLVKPKFGSIATSKQIGNPLQGIKTLISIGDKASEFAWRSLRDTLIYTLNRIPEISDDIINVDNAMKWGFNWEIGPFKMIDAIDPLYLYNRATDDGVNPPEILREINRFYPIPKGKPTYWDFGKKDYQEIPFKPEEFKLEILKDTGSTVEEKQEYSIIDLGDGVFCMEFHSKMNAIGGEILQGTLKAIDIAEREGVGLVIANQGNNFSAGANIMLIAVAIAEGEFGDISRMIKAFQKSTMAIKYAKVPVVVAPFNLTLGGGCEYALHADAINAYAETYMGLVEVGVGLLPAGGGTKEMAIRSIDLAEHYKVDPTPFLFKRFENIGMAKVSISADNLYELGYMDEKDSVTMNLDHLISDSKKKAIALATNYRPPNRHKEYKAPGRSIAGSIKSQLWNMGKGGFATEFEVHMGSLIADILCGGDVPPGTMITEDYLLELEREGFLKLCGNKKTIERIHHMLKTGKPLRN
ncbi:MAG: 3-hydroxyacyl-CoA dehydrogenase/enoyl-CoA hydratase family protein [Deltaproteobacteria bacterium]|nr:3-hydroxyacyl-CoA dehydrogenase/enoyl-CoA hydratase family protein [Deltaproteobacteria bacterium]